MRGIVAVMFVSACLFSDSTFANTILWDAVKVQYWDASHTGTATWTMWTDEDQCDPSIALSVAFHSDATGRPSLHLYGSYCILWPMQIVSLFQYGEVIDRNSIRDPNRIFLDNCMENRTWNDTTVANRSSFILGFFTGVEGLGEPDEEWAYYGWAMLQFSHGELSLVSSAVALDADGIYAGTGNTIPRSIPEPSATVLLLLGLAILVARRKTITKPIMSKLDEGGGPGTFYAELLSTRGGSEFVRE